jgi:Xaa-Pro aminopeptidase
MTTIDLHQSRCQRAQEEMRQQGIDLLFVAPSSDLLYLTGHPVHISERLKLFILPASGAPVMVVPELEAPVAQPFATFFSLTTWSDSSDPYAAVRSVLPQPAATIAVTNQMWSVHLLNLQTILPASRFSAAVSILAPLRRIKDAAEITAMRRAAAAADAAMAEIVTMPLAGKTERQVARHIGDLLIAHGHRSVEFAIVGSGPNSGSPHHVTSDRMLQQGDGLVLDFGGILDDYFSDVTRSFFLGEPPAEYRRIYRIVREAQQAAFEAIRPGATCQHVDRAARKVITDAGYGSYFVHRLGHGLGLDVHEEPYMVEGNTLPLQPGMVFSDEPGIYLPGRFGVRIEDAVLATATGAERLNSAPRDLLEL